ncbi:adenine-specific methyltransferase EcoRI family protein, partial [Salmonella enterica subsp. enterica]
RNKQLTAAKAAKKDEFYTQLSDIESELQHYRSHFKDKIVYCNCDDPYVSAFFRYFTKNFEFLGLKKLITTCYRSQRIDLFSKNDTEKAIKLEYSGGALNSLPSPDDIGVTDLNGDGDFRSQECIDILKEADIVVTNPPFSLFREYISQLFEYNKNFLIIGNQNAIIYKEIFRFIKDNKLWLGVDNGGKKWFQVPDDYDIQTESRKKIENGIKYFSMGSIMWFTNLDHKKRHEEIILFKNYTAEEYPNYDNYNAIEVSKVSNIPVDYDGVMGVPITFLDKYNPEQFELIGCNRGVNQDANGVYGKGSYLNGKETFKRLFIRNRNPKKRK